MTTVFTPATAPSPSPSTLPPQTVSHPRHPIRQALPLPHPEGHHHRHRNRHREVQRLLSPDEAKDADTNPNDARRHPRLHQFHRQPRFSRPRNRTPGLRHRRQLPPAHHLANAGHRDRQPHRLYRPLDRQSSPHPRQDHRKPRTPLPAASTSSPGTKACA